MGSSTVIIIGGVAFGGCDTGSASWLYCTMICGCEKGPKGVRQFKVEASSNHRLTQKKQARGGRL